MNEIGTIKAYDSQSSVAQCTSSESCEAVEAVGSVVEWLKRRARNQHGLGSKPARTILLCPWERYFTAHSPAWWSWQAVLNYSHISIKITSGQRYLGISGSRPGVIAYPM